ncbi:ribosomal protein L1 [Flagelloscypha sp. PMI_526]|nr:ribosomal protein L1 [Flagelloscypha sp. PMI_526]
MFASLRPRAAQPCISGIFNPTYQRTFSTTLVVRARKEKGASRRIPSKKLQAAKTKRRDEAWVKENRAGEKLPLTQAIQVLRAVEVTRPLASYELSIKTKAKAGANIVKGRFELPHKVEIKSDETIVVFAEGRKAMDAKKAGAHVVGGLELIDRLLTNKIRPTVNGEGTVTDDIAGYFRRLGNTMEWKGNREGSISLPIAKLRFTPEQVTENVRSFLDSVKIATGNTKAPASSTGRRSRQKDDGNKRIVPIGKVILTSTQGPIYPNC